MRHWTASPGIFWSTGRRRRIDDGLYYVVRDGIYWADGACSNGIYKEKERDWDDIVCYYGDWNFGFRMVVGYFAHVIAAEGTGHGSGVPGHGVRGKDSVQKKQGAE